MARDERRGGEQSTADELKAQLMLADAEIKTARRRKAQVDAAQGDTTAGASKAGRSAGQQDRTRLAADSARAGEALAAAQRRKLELETMIRDAEARAANERQQAETVVEQMRRQTDVRLHAEQERLQAEFSQAAGAMDDLRRARADAESHFQRERERLEAQIAQARDAMVGEAQRIRSEMEAAKRAAGEKAERIRREQAEAERRLRASTEARLEAERRKLQSELSDTMSSLSRATQDLTSAQGAKRDAQREAERLAMELRAAEQRQRQRERGGAAGADDGLAEASRRLASAQSAGKSRRAQPSNVVQFQGRKPSDEPFDPSDTMVALRTELSTFEDKVSRASQRIDAAERARAQARRAQMLVEEKLARQRALEEDVRYRLQHEAESLLAEERGRGAGDESDAEQAHREALKAEEKRLADASAASMIDDIKSQLSDGSVEDSNSVIERNLRLRDEAQHAVPAPDPSVEKAAEERKRAKEALDRAREHVQRIKRKYDSE